jgi:phenylacetate-CoA ligase
MSNFLSVKNISSALKSYQHIPRKDWASFEMTKRFHIFHEMVDKVIAYKKFLKSEKFDHNKVKSPADTHLIPPITKKNYFRVFPLEKKLWPRLLNQALVATSTSGSTGKSSYFVRSAELDWQYSILAEYFINNGPKGPTLLVDCFGMGVWIGGLITYQAFYYTANRGKSLTIITPGINKKEIFLALRELAPQYKNIIIAGYPPFIKDIVDETVKEGIKLKKWNCRFIFAAESFSEIFRDYIAKASGVKDVYKDTMNIYGTAELGAMAFETPSSIFIRRLALSHPQIFKELFGDKKIPTLCQYNPTFVNFEEQAGEILITANGAMPFCRYQVGDSGGVYSLDKITEVFRNHNIDLAGEAKKAGVELLKLPFVYVYERNDFSTTLYGLQIYPQTIKRALEIPELSKPLTGKFVIETHYDKKSDQYLKVNIELKPGFKANSKLYSKVEKSIVVSLLKENSEYRELTTMLTSDRTKPKLFFWSYNDEKYFRSGGKQQWLKK